MLAPAGWQTFLSFFLSFFLWFVWLQLLAAG
jgi:hypothetical protein